MGRAPLEPLLPNPRVDGGLFPTQPGGARAGRGLLDGGWMGIEGAELTGVPDIRSVQTVICDQEAFFLVFSFATVCQPPSKPLFPCSQTIPSIPFPVPVLIPLSSHKKIGSAPRLPGRSLEGEGGGGKASRVVCPQARGAAVSSPTGGSHGPSFLFYIALQSLSYPVPHIFILASVPTRLA